MTTARKLTQNDLLDLAAQSRRLLNAVERGELAADDAVGRRVVEALRLVAELSESLAEEWPGWLPDTNARIRDSRKFNASGWLSSTSASKPN